MIEAARLASSLLLFVSLTSNLNPPEVVVKFESLVSKSVTVTPPLAESDVVVASVVSLVVVSAAEVVVVS